MTDVAENIKAAVANIPLPLGVDGFFVASPVPEAFYPYLAQVALGWGGFEVTFNSVLGIFVDASGNKYRDNWRFFSFEQRHSMFAKEVDLNFEGAPNILGFLHGFAAEAIEVQQLRNRLLHSHIFLRVDADIPSIVAKGRQKGVNFEQAFDINDLIALYYRISYLRGYLAHLANGWPDPLPDTPRAPRFPSSEIEILKGIFCLPPIAS